MPIFGHIGLIPSYITWTGWRAVGKTADEALALWHHTTKLGEAGVFALELEVVPDQVAKFLSKNSSLVMLGMGAGRHADVQYLFTEDVCCNGRNHKSRHGKVRRDFVPELERMQNGRIAAFREFRPDVDSGGYPGPGHTVPIRDEEFDAFLSDLNPRFAQAVAKYLGPGWTNSDTVPGSPCGSVAARVRPLAVRRKTLSDRLVRTVKPT